MNAKKGGGEPLQRSTRRSKARAARIAPHDAEGVIRQITGGSYTTISPVLNEWKAKQTSTAAPTTGTTTRTSFAVPAD